MLLHNYQLNFYILATKSRKLKQIYLLKKYLIPTSKTTENCAKSQHKITIKPY